jgi:hypothetical protein
MFFAIDYGPHPSPYINVLLFNVALNKFSRKVVFISLRTNQQSAVITFTTLYICKLAYLLGLRLFKDAVILLRVYGV